MIKRCENMLKTNDIIKNELSNYSNKDTKLTREVNKGNLIKIVNDLYETNSNTPSYLLANNISVNIDLVKNKLIESNYINADTNFNIDILKELLIKKFSEIDYSDAKEDVLPFIKDTTSLNIWSKDLFINIINNLT